MPTVINRHHYKSDRHSQPFPRPWMYVGRGTPLGNPFTIQEHGIKAIELYRRWLWAKLKARDPDVIRELERIQENTHLVCSCAPRPCHGDVIVRAWRWWTSTRGLSVVNGGSQ
jgi:hypothetical protein